MRICLVGQGFPVGCIETAHLSLGSYEAANNRLGDAQNYLDLKLVLTLASKERRNTSFTENTLLHPFKVRARVKETDWIKPIVEVNIRLDICGAAISERVKHRYLEREMR